MTPQVISLSSLGSTAWIPVDYKQNPFNIGLACVVSDTPNLTYQVEFTLDDIFNTSITPTAFTHNLLVGKTSNFSSNQIVPVRAIRLTTTAYTSGTVTLTALQGGVNPIIYTPNPVTLFQSGIPFWIPPGNGGANGLSFTGTRGVFTLSAESPMTNAYLALTTGGYCYLPAGAGGLVAGGWYWCKMTAATDGEVFSETYSGSGQPDLISSPTVLPDLASGRITQEVLEVYGPTFTLPGGSVGPNGYTSIMMKWLINSSATVKRVRVRTPGVVLFNTGLTTANLVQLLRATRFNRGVEDAQIGNRMNSSIAAWDGSVGGFSISDDFTTLDTRVDQTISFTFHCAANTDSIILWPLLFEVMYGA